MKSVYYLIMRRMRPPLLALIGAYAVAITGLVLVPGTDAAGNPWKMDFLHAFYFVSYMATTIGFGEIPFEFTPAQRLWTLLCIYLTVVAWVYAIGKLITLAQDPALRHAVTEQRFARAVRLIDEPFYLVCGYGDTGTALVAALSRQLQRAVVVDLDPERINALTLESYPVYVPGLCADAGLPDTLKRAGLGNPRCAGVVALTNHDEVNLHVAITAKLLNPALKVICRAETREVVDNMASFNTDHIIDPFEAFADRLFTALHTPSLDVLRQWLTGNAPLAEPLNPPRGLWVLCGFGRFGKALYRRLRESGIDTRVIESNPEGTGYPEVREHFVLGWGTEAVTLREARVEDAAGIVAGTHDDTNNLSILMTANDLNPYLFTVARQNRHHNRELFQAIRPDLHVEGSQIIADQIRTLLNTPLLVSFLARAREHGDPWARKVLARLRSVLGAQIPAVWEVRLDEARAPAACEALRQEPGMHVGDLRRDPRLRDRRLPCLVLMILRGVEPIVLPDGDLALQPDDAVLLAGARHTRRRVALTLMDPETCLYVCTGRHRPPERTWAWWPRGGAGASR